MKTYVKSNRKELKTANCLALILIVSIFLTANLPCLAEIPDIHTIDALVKTGMKIWDVPGLSLAIIKDNEVFMAKGYGIKEIGKSDQVDDNTLFSLGSCSKAIGAVAVAICIDDGQINWSDRIADVMPWFRLNDTWPTYELRVKDIVCHRAGTGGTNQLRPISWNRKDYLLRLRYGDTNRSFRTYNYTNDMYILGGQLVEEVTGKTWDNFARERIWDSLEMNSTTSRMSRILKTEDRATPHRFAKRFIGSAKTPGPILEPAIWDFDDDIAVPSGGIASSAADMARWIKFHLDTKDSPKLLRYETLQILHTPHTVIDNSVWWMIGEENLAYAMGWVSSRFLGEKIVCHGGEALGFNTCVAFLPEKGFGVFVSTNRQSYLPFSLTRQIITQFIGDEEAKKKDWHKIPLASIKNENDVASMAEDARSQGRLSKVGPSLALESYTGTYKNNFSGTLEVKLEEGKLVATILGRRPIIMKLEHWHIDLFHSVSRDLPTIDLYFSINKVGRVVEVNVSYFGKFFRFEKERN